MTRQAASSLVAPLSSSAKFFRASLTNFCSFRGRVSPYETTAADRTANNPRDCIEIAAKRVSNYAHLSSSPCLSVCMLRAHLQYNINIGGLYKSCVRARASAYRVYDRGISLSDQRSISINQRDISVDPCYRNPKEELCAHDSGHFSSDATSRYL